LLESHVSSVELLAVQSGA
jgi:hypothetical protein